jgi:hypothetical protein
MIVPISITSVDWKPFIQAITEYTGASPTRTLDENGIKLDKPSAFIQSLANKLKLSEHDTRLNHCSIGLLMTINRDVAVEFVNYVSTKAFSILGHNLYLSTMTVYEWLQLTLSVHANSSKGLKFIANEVYSLLCQLGFADLWQEHKKHSLSDQTFIWK